jgi:hypothetical protein
MFKDCAQGAFAYDSFLPSRPPKQHSEPSNVRREWPVASNAETTTSPSTTLSFPPRRRQSPSSPSRCRSRVRKSSTLSATEVQPELEPVFTFKFDRPRQPSFTVNAGSPARLHVFGLGYGYGIQLALAPSEMEEQPETEPVPIPSITPTSLSTPSLAPLPADDISRLMSPGSCLQVDHAPSDSTCLSSLRLSELPPALLSQFEVPGDLELELTPEPASTLQPSDLTCSTINSLACALDQE